MSNWEEYTKYGEYYQKPHVLMELVEKGVILKSEYVLMDILLQLENHFRRVGEWFYRSDKLIEATGLLSPNTIGEARDGLKAVGLIDFKLGNRTGPTKYKILIPREWLNRKDDVVQ